MKLSDRLKQTLVETADAEAPQEACGLLSAPSGTSAGERDQHGFYGLWRAENVAAEPETSFLIDPEHQRDALEQMWRRGEELVGIFHSHPRSGPEPSERDSELALSIEAARPAGVDPLVWVICGVDGDGQLGAFWAGPLA